MTELKVGHVRMARRDAPFKRARELIEIDTAAQRAKWRRSPMSTPTPRAHGVTACAKFRDQPLALTDRILRLRCAANGKQGDRRDHRRQGFHGLSNQREWRAGFEPLPPRFEVRGSTTAWEDSSDQECISTAQLRFGPSEPRVLDWSREYTGRRQKTSQSLP